jgi:DNA-binding MarR family transcriptional regulator
MRLQEELGLRKGFAHLPHEALLNLYYTSSLLKKTADAFFRDHGLTDVQFNLMMLLFHQADEGEGLTQVELSRMMLVNRANITGLVDRMEKAGLVERRALPGDRRYNTVVLTTHGRELLLKVQDAYRQTIERLMGGITHAEMRHLTDLLGRVREHLADHA